MSFPLCLLPISPALRSRVTFGRGNLAQIRGRPVNDEWHGQLADQCVVFICFSLRYIICMLISYVCIHKYSYVYIYIYIIIYIYAYTPLHPRFRKGRVQNVKVADSFLTHESALCICSPEKAVFCESQLDFNWPFGRSPACPHSSALYLLPRPDFRIGHANLQVGYL